MSSKPLVRSKPKGDADRKNIYQSIIILSAVFLLAISPHFAGAASNGTNWGIEGGGFCSGDFTVFNVTTTATPNNAVDVMSCASLAGGIVAGQVINSTSSDTGMMITSLLGHQCPNGCEVDFRSGVYAMTNPITLNRNVVRLHGTLPGGDQNYYAAVSLQNGNLNGTFLEAKASMTNMIQGGLTNTYSGGSSGTVAHTKIWVDGIQFWSNCLATNGINLASNEVSSYNKVFNNFFGLRINLGNSGGTCGFSGTGVIMDGNEDSDVAGNGWAGALDTGRGGAAVDVQWQVTGGNVIFSNDFFGGAISASVSAQTVSFQGGTVNDVKLLGNLRQMSFYGPYMANYVTGQTPTARINLNGFTLDSLSFYGVFLLINGSGTPGMGMFAGTGTVSNQLYSGCVFDFTAGTGTWNIGGATLTKQVTDGSNHVHLGTAPTGFPFTVDGNNNF